MYPLKLKPVLKNYIWGGKKLKTDFNKKSDKEIVAESWELSCNKDGNSIIENGKYKGMTLLSYIENSKEDVLGENCKAFENFPILIKLIDAKDNLSVQVHPDNEYALKVEGENGKTEMWYVIDCEEGAELLYGFKNQISREEFEKHINNNTLIHVINRVKVKKGDVFFIKAGTIHAIGKGIVVAEIQQNSNITYRVFDYGRVGFDGKPRELHIKKALEVTNLFSAKNYLQNESKNYDGYSLRLLASHEYFTVYLYDVIKKVQLYADNKSFNSILILKGNPVIEANNIKMELQKGDSIFIPANMGKYKIIGKAEIIFTKV